MEIARTGADLGIEAGDRFKIVVEHIGPRRDDRFQRFRAALQEIGGQHFDCGAGGLAARGADGLGDMLCPAVIHVVTINRRNDHVIQAQLLDRIRHASRLEHIQRVWAASGDVAEGATAGARSRP